MPNSARMFTQQELDEFEKEFMELAIEALDRGDLETARKWCLKNKETEWYVHDAYLLWIPEMLTFIRDTYGEDVAVGAIKDAARQELDIYNADRIQMIEKEGLKGHIKYLIDYFWRHRFGTYTIEEDDEKVIFNHHPCGSGGRLIDRKTNYPKTFFNSPVGYTCLEKPGPHTWGETGVPIYCAHCSWIHEILPIEQLGCGAQWWVQTKPFPKKFGDPCVHHIYKDPNAIPDKYYDRLNIQKRASSIESVHEERLLTNDEIKEYETGYMDLALAAIDAGDFTAAKKWCNRFEETKFPMHDAGCITVSAILNYLADRIGEHAAIAALKYSTTFFCDAIFYTPKTSGVKIFGVKWWVEFMVDFWRQHVSPRKVEEDDEKFIFTIKECGSGGRLISSNYYNTPAGHHRIEKKGYHTWGRSDVPVYCGHCTWIHEIWPIFFHGKGSQLWVHVPPFAPDAPGDHCVHYIYKDPKNIPHECYQRIGMEHWFENEEEK